MKLNVLLTSNVIENILYNEYEVTLMSKNCGTAAVLYLIPQHNQKAHQFCIDYKIR